MSITVTSPVVSWLDGMASGHDMTPPPPATTMPPNEKNTPSTVESSVSRLKRPHEDSTRASPAPSTASSLTSVTATPPPSALGVISASLPGSTTQPPHKKRKLTLAEKEVARKTKEELKQKREEEKVAREAKRAEEADLRRQKAEEKEAQRREKDLKKEEEKQKRDEEKAKRDEERQKKDDEKRRKDEAIAKKEAAQSRMFSFFKPATKLSSGSNASPAAQGGASVADVTDGTEVANVDTHADTPASPLKKVLTDYEKTFLPYELPNSAIRAPISRYTWDEEALQHMQKQVDSALQDRSPAQQIASLLDQIRATSFSSGGSSTPFYSTRDVVVALSEYEDRPAHTTDDGSLRPMEVLRRIPVKYIKFQEDVRPPYIGTHTTLRTKPEARQLAVQPTRKQRDELDYDYDSEAEWEEPEEGDDLISEAGSDDDDEADEMDDFLDDGDADNPARKRLINVDSDPIVAAILWEDVKGRPAATSASGYNVADCGVEVLLDNVTGSIDPFSSSYWATSSNAGPSSGPASSDHRSGMNPPRIPLQPRPNVAINGLAILQDTKTNAAGKPATKPSGPTLQGADFDTFKRIVDGSRHTKAGILSALKLELPDVKGPVLDDTLKMFAKREGPTIKEKKWVIYEQGNASA